MYSYNLTTATTTTITLCTYPPPPPALPFELISLIIQATHPTKASLSNYALVSKSWTYPAQHLLFQHLSLHSRSDYLSFQYAIQRTPALANTVRSIRVLIDSNQPRPQGGGVSQFQFGQVVQVCEGLNEVDISLFGEASFEEGLIAKLRSRPGLSSLRFMNWSGDVYALVQLLSGCRFLQNLVIGGSTPPEVPLRAVSSDGDGDGDGEIDASFSAASFPCTLTKLGLVFQRSPSIDFFRWLLDNSKESLKVLDIERELEGWAAAATSHRSSPALISSTQVSATLSSSSSTSVLYHPPFPIPPPPPPPSSHSSSTPTSSAIYTASSSPTALTTTPLTSASTSSSSSTPTTISTPTPTPTTTTTTTPPLHYLLHTFHLTLVSLYTPTCSRSTAKVIEKCRMLKRVVVEDATCTCVAFVPPPSASSVTNNGTGLPLSTIGGIGAGVGGVMRSLLIRRTGTGTGEAGLEHLAFGIDSDTSLQGVLDYVRRGGRGRELGSPSSASSSSSALSPTSLSGTELERGSGSGSGLLKSITLYLRDDYDYDAGKKHGYGHKQIASLRMACAMAGVELKLVGASASGGASAGGREEGGVKRFRALVRDR